MVRWKARIVAKGYSQVPGVDFEQTYAPVGRTTSLHILLTLAAQRDMELRQADVEGAYLNGTLEEEIYMAFPEGYKPKNDHATGLRLVKSLYGLKQSGRAWWIELGTALAVLGSRSSNRTGVSTTEQRPVTMARPFSWLMWTTSSSQRPRARRSTISWLLSRIAGR